MLYSFGKEQKYSGTCRVIWKNSVRSDDDYSAPYTSGWSSKTVTLEW